MTHPTTPSGRMRLYAMGCFVLAVAVVITSIVWWTDTDNGPARTGTDASTGLRFTRATTTLGRCVDPGRLDPGRQIVRVTNPSTRAMDLSLRVADSSTLVGEIEPLAPGVTRDMTVTLGGGRYRFVCSVEDDATVTGPDIDIAGPSQRTASAAAITAADLAPVVVGYKNWVIAGFPKLVEQTDRLRDLIHSGSDRAAARDAWLAAHHTYETFGAVYDAFGDLDGEINGLATGLAAGTDDPDFTGFHRVEHQLWSSEPVAAAGPAVDDLDARVRQLQQEFPTMGVDQHQIPLRTHEILENALQFDLSGISDYGSHSYLTTLAADIDGTRELVDLLHPLLAPRMPDLAGVDHELDASAALVARVSAHPATAAVPLSQLDATDRDGLDASISGLLERLAPIAVIGTERRDG